MNVNTRNIADGIDRTHRAAFAALIAVVLLSPAAPASAQDPNWTVNPNEFAASMSVTSVVLFSGLEVASPNDELAAFVNGQVRGATKPIQVGNRWFFFLTVFGQVDGERVSFRLHRASDSATHDVFENATFGADKILGNTTTPFLLTANVATGIETDASETLRLTGNYPEPFVDRTTIGYTLSSYAPVRLDVYNLLGQRIRSLVDESQPAGEYEVEFDASSLPEGVYLYRLQSRGIDATRSMVHTR